MARHPVKKLAEAPKLPDETRDRLLAAAGEVFAEQGFRHATVRDICRKAGANIAAVNYHFRDKQGLYREVIRSAQVCAFENFPPLPPEAQHAPAEVRLRAFILNFLLRVFAPGRPAWHGKLMAQEMGEPTEALDFIVKEGIRPNFQAITAILTELLGPGAAHASVALCAKSIVGQCLFYHFARPVIERLEGPAAAHPDLERLAEHIARFSLQGVRGLRAGGRAHEFHRH